MTNTLKPETSSEILWMLFSVLMVEPHLQVEILGGLPHMSQSDENALTENGAAYLLSFIDNHYVAWLDEFEPCPVAQQLFDLVGTMDYRQSYESFMNGEDWQRLRELAKHVLEEADLEPCFVPQFINFSEFMEIVHPDDLAPFAHKI